MKGPAINGHVITEKPARGVVIGSSCSGKTILARHMAQLLGVAHIELDAINWKSNWHQRSTEEFRALTKSAVAQEHWIADGNYSKARDIVWDRATVVIWLNYPFFVVFWRALRRTLMRVLRKEKLFSDNHETFRRAFLSKDSILWWVVTSFNRQRNDYCTVFRQGEFPHLTLIELGKPSDADQLLRCLERRVSEDMRHSEKSRS